VEFFQIVLLSIAAAVSYGVLHDQVTARVCVEYFTIGHPQIVPSESPTILACVWGVVATWWMGLLLGIPLALSARIGRGVRLSARELLKPMAILLLAMGILALAAGIIGYVVGSSGRVRLPEELSERVPADKHAVFITDWFAHLASYASGGFGGLGLCGWAILHRRRAQARVLSAVC
jgi:hypothetical protein